MLIAQTAQFGGVTPDVLYEAFLSAEQHAAMTAGSRPATFFRPSIGNVARGEVGDQLQAFGSVGPDGETRFSLTAQILALVPGRLIVMTWKNIAWEAALDLADITDLPSTVTLTFKANIAGAEVRLVQANVPDYPVRIADTGEVGPASAIINTHWSLLYWEPMRVYFSALAWQPVA